MHTHTMHTLIIIAHIYVSGFFIFLGVAIPVMSSVLWLVWQRCDDGEQDDEMKNSSYREQVFAWVLGVGLLLCSICMIVFLSFLIVSNSLALNGANDGTDIVVKVLPQVSVCCVCMCVRVCVDA